MNFLKEALSYCKRGYSVIPIKPNGKKPLVQWKKYQTQRATEKKIKKWWEKWPDANVGIVTGAISGLVVIDIDSPEGLKELKKRLQHYDFNALPRSKTGKGSHLFFKHPRTKILNRTRVLPGVDVRGDDGYVVAPPSRHESGKRYKWKVPLDSNPPELSPELLKLITSPSRNGRGKGPTQVLEGKIPEGQRNDTLTSLAGSMWGRGMLPESIQRALLEENRLRCKPPLQENEVETIVASVTQYKPGKTKSKAGSDTKKLPGDLVGRLIHPAIHIEPDFQSVGFVNREGTKNVFKIITSNGDSHLAEDIKDALLVEPDICPSLSGRWRQSNNPMTLSKSVALLEKKLLDLVCLEDKRWYPTFALWAAGTYLFPAFCSYPYLQLTGEKGSGKTKVQDIFECVAFNAFKFVGVTPAVLFRIVHVLRPTLLIDEAEKMNTDQAGEIRAIINAGYKLGATVPHCVGDDHHVKYFEVYSPKCLAGINGLGDVTEDRCITVVMFRPPFTDTRQNISVDQNDPAWEKIRDGFYRLPISYASKVMDGFDPSRLPHWLTARDKELWEPLLRIAAVVDEESGKKNLFDDVLALAKKSVKAKGLSFETDEILEVLETELDGENSMKIRPGELVEELEESLNTKVSSQWVGDRLRTLGFKKCPRSKKGVVYEVNSAKIAEIRDKYSTPPD